MNFLLHQRKKRDHAPAGKDTVRHFTGAGASAFCMGCPPRRAKGASRVARRSAERAFPPRPRLKAKTFLPRPGSRAFQREPKKRAGKKKNRWTRRSTGPGGCFPAGYPLKNILDVVDQITHRVGGLAGLLLDLLLIAHQLGADIAHHHAGCQAGADSLHEPDGILIHDCFLQNLNAFLQKVFPPALVCPEKSSQAKKIVGKFRYQYLKKNGIIILPKYEK